MARHKHADLMIAYANDRSLEIQCYSGYDDVWRDDLNPFWLEGNEYRIKPKKAEKGDFICEIDGVKWWLGPEAPQGMSWGDAKEWVEKQGCILPPRQVLLMCYIKEDIRKQFKQEWYWSSSEYCNKPAGYAWFQYFTIGSQTYDTKGNTLYVHGVFCG